MAYKGLYWAFEALIIDLSNFYFWCVWNPTSFILAQRLFGINRAKIGISRISLKMFSGLLIEFSNFCWDAFKIEKKRIFKDIVPNGGRGQDQIPKFMACEIGT